MRNNRDKRKPNRIRRSSSRRFRPVIAVGVIALLVFVMGPQLKSIWAMQQEIKELEKQKGSLLKRNAELTDLERQLKTGELVEKIAREELGMIKPEEKMIIRVVPGNQ